MDCEYNYKQAQWIKWAALTPNTAVFIWCHPISGDSARFTSLFLTSGLYSPQAESSPTQKREPIAYGQSVRSWGRDSRFPERFSFEHDPAAKERARVTKEHSPVTKEHGHVLKKHARVTKEHDPVSKEHRHVLKERTRVTKEHDPVTKEHRHVIKERNLVIRQQRPKIKIQAHKKTFLAAFAIKNARHSFPST